MKAVMKVENAGDVRIELTITMTVAQWRHLTTQLTDNLSRSWNVDICALRNAIGRATDAIANAVSGESAPLEDDSR